jgi:nucleoid DNA-binding protein
MSKDKVSTQELIKQLAKRLNINEKLAEDFLKAMFSTIEEELLKGELVKVKNLGTFKLQWNDPRKSVDVTTGDEIMLEGYNKITFTPDSKLKDLVNEPFAYLEPVLLDSDSPVLEPVKTDDGFDTLNILSGQAAEIKSLLSEISALSENNTQQEDETEPHDDDELNIELSEMQYNIGEEKVEKEDASSEPEWIEDENDESLNLDTELTTPIDTEKDAKVENVESILASVESAEDKGIAGVENEEIKPAGQSVSEVEVISHQPETEESANEQVEDKPEENAEELTRRNRGEMLRAASVRKEVPFQMLGQPGILSTPEPFTLRVKSNGKRNNGCLIFIREVNDWNKEVEISPSLWGEEALELFESVLTMTKEKKPKTELTPLQLDILFAAVRIARGDQIRTVKALKARLLQIWPKKPKSITVALKYWAKYETAKP